MKVLIVILLLLFSCKSKESKNEAFLSKEDYEERMIASHREYLHKESKKIEDYIDSIGLNFVESPTGLRYYIMSKGGTDSIKAGEVAIVDYVLGFLNGDTAYSTINKAPQQFVVEFDNVENGLHEGIQKMAVGDSGILILPAHLGHGITGDQTAIPSQSVLVYSLKFLSKIE